MPFKITDGTGFHIKFENGWTISVQFGPGTYSDNYDASMRPLSGNIRGVEYRDMIGSHGSNEAECAIFDAEGKMYDISEEDTVKGYMTANEVLELMNIVAKK